MLKVNEIKELIRALDNSSLVELEIKGENKERLTLRKQGAFGQVTVQQGQEEESAKAPVAALPAAPEAPQKQAEEETKQEVKEEAPAQSAPVDDDSIVEITSPMVGTFYRAPAPDAEPYVKVGDKVEEDTVVCIVEAMKLMNELEAEVSGEIVEILVENEELVEYGQPLFRVKQA